MTISPFAQHQLRQLTAPAPWSVVEAAVNDSVKSFKKSLYMKKSEWFRTTPRHTINALTLRRDNTEITPVFVLDGDNVRSLDEVDLPAGYYETRVIEETKVEWF
jgi:hypothetical protein